MESPCHCLTVTIDEVVHHRDLGDATRYSRSSRGDLLFQSLGRLPSTLRAEGGRVKNSLPYACLRRLVGFAAFRSILRRLHMALDALRMVVQRSTYRNILFCLPLQVAAVAAGVVFVVYGICEICLAATSDEFPNWDDVGDVLMGVFRIAIGIGGFLTAITMWVEWVQLLKLGLHVLLISRVVDVICKWIEQGSGESGDPSLTSLVFDTIGVAVLVCVSCFWVMGLLNSLRFVLLVGGTGWEGLNFVELQLAFESGEKIPRQHRRLPVVGPRVRRSESAREVLAVGESRIKRQRKDSDVHASGYDPHRLHIRQSNESSGILHLGPHMKESQSTDDELFGGAGLAYVSQMWEHGLGRLPPDLCGAAGETRRQSQRRNVKSVDDVIEIESLSDNAESETLDDSSRPPVTPSAAHASFSDDQTSPL